MLPIPRLQGAANFRDVAGIASPYPTREGKRLNPGVGYRSNHLTLTRSDLEAVDTLQISTVIDLRTATEISHTPNQLPRGAETVEIDILGHTNNAANPLAGISIESPAHATRLMEKTNENFVADARMRRQFAQVFTTIADAPGAVVFHCTAGKDRTGWVAAIWQLAAGMSTTDVLADYMVTNEYLAEAIVATRRRLIQTHGDSVAASRIVIHSVQERFLQAGLAAMSDTYGDAQGYLSRGLGLDQSTIERLRTKLLT